ncbi:hypothetical protein CRES_0438 [Corynebacterium resistens DSM 45100]|uniref:DUF3817 domain-containing protein n=1 Tax=Corynebacterium resistens (strain DSM 45100 / JCM 12819 / GTC 2026 / SICGH 158) TaxID=662755 RepID=F8DY59_CORRG|nr:DUF3817 domain-containing protein [Corynebacterium resistens]AEI08801.1 hypothetical protein CRES_0438 [Corynebacterium resistens DSM 45100]
MTNTPVTPERQQRVAKSLKFYSFAAFFTGIWLLILLVEMIFKYLIIGQEEFPQWLSFIGPAHGFVFMVYMITCLDLGTKARWEPSKWISTILAGVVPFLSFYVESKRRKEVKAQFQI